MCRLGVAFVEIVLEVLWLGVSLGVAFDHDLEAVGPIESVKIPIVRANVEVCHIVGDLGRDLADLDSSAVASESGDTNGLEAIDEVLLLDVVLN